MTAQDINRFSPFVSVHLGEPPDNPFELFRRTGVGSPRRSQHEVSEPLIRWRSDEGRTDTLWFSVPNVGCAEIDFSPHAAKWFKTALDVCLKRIYTHQFGEVWRQSHWRIGKDLRFEIRHTAPLDKPCRCGRTESVWGLRTWLKPVVDGAPVVVMLPGQGCHVEVAFRDAVWLCLRGHALLDLHEALEDAVGTSWSDGFYREE